MSSIADECASADSNLDAKASLTASASEVESEELIILDDMELSHALTLDSLRFLHDERDVADKDRTDVFTLDTKILVYSPTTLESSLFVDLNPHTGGIHRVP
jgi:hypothetical protein